MAVSFFGPTVSQRLTSKVSSSKPAGTGSFFNQPSALQVITAAVNKARGTDALGQPVSYVGSAGQPVSLISGGAASYGGGTPSQPSTPQEFLQAGNIVTAAARGETGTAQELFEQASPEVQDIVVEQARQTSPVMGAQASFESRNLQAPIGLETIKSPLRTTTPFGTSLAPSVQEFKTMQAQARERTEAKEMRELESFSPAAAGFVATGRGYASKAKTNIESINEIDEKLAGLTRQVNVDSWVGMPIRVQQNMRKIKDLQEERKALLLEFMGYRVGAGAKFGQASDAIKRQEDYLKSQGVVFLPVGGPKPVTTKEGFGIAAPPEKFPQAGFDLPISLGLRERLAIQNAPATFITPGLQLARAGEAAIGDYFETSGRGLYRIAKTGSKAVPYGNQTLADVLRGRSIGPEAAAARVPVARITGTERQTGQAMRVAGQVGTTLLPGPVGIARRGLAIAAAETPDEVITPLILGGGIGFLGKVGGPFLKATSLYLPKSGQSFASVLGYGAKAIKTAGVPAATGLYAASAFQGLAAASNDDVAFARATRQVATGLSSFAVGATAGQLAGQKFIEPWIGIGGTISMREFELKNPTAGAQLKQDFALAKQFEKLSIRPRKVDLSTTKSISGKTAKITETFLRNPGNKSVLYGSNAQLAQLPKGTKLVPGDVDIGSVNPKASATKLYNQLKDAGLNVRLDKEKGKLTWRIYETVGGLSTKGIEVHDIKQLQQNASEVRNFTSPFFKSNLIKDPSGIQMTKLSVEAKRLVVRGYFDPKAGLREIKLERLNQFFRPVVENQMFPKAVTFADVLGISGAKQGLKSLPAITQRGFIGLPTGEVGGVLSGAPTVSKLSGIISGQSSSSSVAIRQPVQTIAGVLGTSSAVGIKKAPAIRSLAAVLGTSSVELKQPANKSIASILGSSVGVRKQPGTSGVGLITSGVSTVPLRQPTGPSSVYLKQPSQKTLESVLGTSYSPVRKTPSTPSSVYLRQPKPSPKTIASILGTTYPKTRRTTYPSYPKPPPSIKYFYPNYKAKKPYIPPAPKFLPPYKPRRLTKSKLEQGFRVLIRAKGKKTKTGWKAGKWKPLSKNVYSLQEALAKGGSFAQKTIKRSFKLQPAIGKPASFLGKWQPGMFRKTKSGSFVEQTKYAIDDPLEKLQLKQAKKATAWGF